MLRSYGSKHQTKLSRDGSSGATLLQKHGEHWRPVPYGSRAFTKIECQYVHPEKEALDLVHGCKKFHVFIYGRPMLAEIDQKQ